MLIDPWRSIPTLLQTPVQKHKLKRTHAFLDNISVGGVTVEEHDKNLKAFLKAAKEESLNFNEKNTVKKMTEIDLLGYRLSFDRIQPDPNRLNR